MARALLLALLIPISLVQGSDDEATTPAHEYKRFNGTVCQWQCEDCYPGYLEFARVKTAAQSYSPVSKFGDKCSPTSWRAFNWVAGFFKDPEMKRLCCEKTKYNYKPEKACEMVPGKLCDKHATFKHTLFATNDGGSDSAFCCDNNMFEKKVLEEDLDMSGFPPGTCEWTKCAAHTESCEKGYTEMSQVNNAISGENIGEFGEACSTVLNILWYRARDTTVRTLCCKNEAVQADPIRHCGPQQEDVCPQNKFTLFTVKVKEAPPTYSGYCCHPKVYANRTKRFINSASTTTSFLLILTSAISMMH